MLLSIHHTQHKHCLTIRVIKIRQMLNTKIQQCSTALNNFPMGLEGTMCEHGGSSSVCWDMAWEQGQWFKSSVDWLQEKCHEAEHSEGIKPNLWKQNMSDKLCIKGQMLILKYLAGRVWWSCQNYLISWTTVYVLLSCCLFIPSSLQVLYMFSYIIFLYSYTAMWGKLF